MRVAIIPGLQGAFDGRSRPEIEDNRNDLCENLCSRWPFPPSASVLRNSSSWGCCRISPTASRSAFPKTGILVSGYALSVTLGSPLVALALSRMDRKRALLILMGMFLVGNALCALAPTFLLLLFAPHSHCALPWCVLRHRQHRGLSPGAAHRAGAGNRAHVQRSHAGERAGRSRRDRPGPGVRMAICLLGLVPIGLVAGIGLACLVPHQPAEKIHLKHEFHAVVRPQVQLVLAMSTLSSVSLFCVFTYIAPILEQVTHLSPAAVTRVLVVFGVGITVGNLLGGRLADWKQMPVLIAGILLLILIFLAMPLLETKVRARGAHGVCVGLRSFCSRRSLAGAHRGPGKRSAESGLDPEPGCFQSGQRAGRKPWRHHADRGCQPTAIFPWAVRPWPACCVAGGPGRSAVWNRRRQGDPRRQNGIRVTFKTHGFRTRSDNLRRPPPPHRISNGMKKKLRVGVLFGGRSGEHEVSLLRLLLYLKAIDRSEFEVVPIGITKQGRWLVSGDAERLLAGEFPRGGPSALRAGDPQHTAPAASWPRDKGVIVPPMPPRRERRRPVPFEQRRSSISPAQDVLQLDVVFPGAARHVWRRWHHARPVRTRRA